MNKHQILYFVHTYLVDVSPTSSPILDIITLKTFAILIEKLVFISLGVSFACLYFCMIEAEHVFQRFMARFIFFLTIN